MDVHIDIHDFKTGNVEVIYPYNQPDPEKIGILTN